MARLKPPLMRFRRNRDLRAALLARAFRAKHADESHRARLRVEIGRVTWVDGELWHGTWEAEESELRRIDPQNGEVLEQLDMPAGIAVSGLESDGGDRFFCGGGGSGKVRAIRRPKRGSATKPKM